MLSARDEPDKALAELAVQATRIESPPKLQSVETYLKYVQYCTLAVMSSKTMEIV